METINAKIANENIYSAIDYINSVGNDTEVAKTYSMAVKKLYWADKGAKNLVLVGNAGINYLLTKASESKDTNKATELKSWAKTIAYDLSANTWPGWGDEGVIISKAEMYAGLHAAKLNLTLATELNKPKDKVSIAHWLLGAHYLADKNYAESANSFSVAINISSELNDHTSMQLNSGYLAITKILSGDNEGKTALTKAINELEAIGSKDSEFYIQQLNTALKIFSN